jgi:hypothetical protein
VLPQVKPVPAWIGPVFAVLAIGTVPWTVYLAMTLPEDIETRNYRWAWVGFDAGLIALLVLTAYLAYRGQRYVAMTATATATALIIDAWFDVSLHVNRVIARRLRQLARRADPQFHRRWSNRSRSGSGKRVE